jgi:phage terminase small subunit
MGLTPRQLRFVDEYLVDLNGSQAAIRAGYSRKTAHAAASRLRRNARVSAALASRKWERTQRTTISRERGIEQLARIAFADIRDLYDPQGQLLPIPSLPDSIATAVASLRAVERRSAKGQVRLQSFSVRLEDRVRALVALLDHVSSSAVGASQTAANYDLSLVETFTDEELERAKCATRTVREIFDSADVSAGDRSL